MGWQSRRAGHLLKQFARSADLKVKRMNESPSSELLFLEFEHRRVLDDESGAFIAELRGQRILSDDEWGRVKQFFAKALNYLSHEAKTSQVNSGGHKVFDPDADPRNADWIRIVAARRLVEHYIPHLAALC